jgi:dihydrolipoamide dehydrogenase
LLVIGSGAIGMEFASFFTDMGSQVTVVEILPQILPVEDAEIAAAARTAFEKRGMRIFTDTRVSKVERRGEGVVASLQRKDAALETLGFDRVILAVGIEGNVENLGLEGTGVRVDRSHIEIDKWCATGEPGVYAIGDVVGPPWLAHKASHEGVLCVERIAGVQTHPLRVDRIPGCTYCHPQVASVGLTEAAARAAGYQVKVGRFPFLANGKALAMGDPSGLVKTVFDAATGELLGAHMVGPEVTELIQGFAMARTLEATEADLISTVFPHPTLSEAMHESVLAAFGKAINY